MVSVFRILEQATSLEHATLGLRAVTVLLDRGDLADFPRWFFSDAFHYRKHPTG